MLTDLTVPHNITMSISVAVIWREDCRNLL